MNSLINRPAAKWLALLLLAVLWFGTLGYRKLITPDEGRYAEIAREMVVSGDWNTPRLNGIKYFEKPALQYWATAASFEILGESDFAARIWPGITGFLGLLAVFFTSRKLWGEATAWLAGGILASSAWWIGNGHFLTLDMGVSAFLTFSLCGFLLAQRDGASAKENRNGMLMAWAAIGLAVLSKGLIGLVLPGIAIVAYSIICRDLKLWTKLHLFKGLALALLITVPWFLTVSKANPEFAQFFFIHEHFERFLSTEHRREGPIYYFLPILAIGLLPWTSLLPQALKKSWKADGQFKVNRFLLIWAVFIFAFFSKSGSKLPSYILPIFPALAMLMAQTLMDISGKALRWHLLWIAIPGLILIGAYPWVSTMESSGTPQIYNAAYALWLVAAGVVLTAGAVFGFILAGKGKKEAAIATMALAGLIGGQLPMVGHESYAYTNSSYHIVATVKPLLKPDSKLYAVHYYDQSLPFYLKQTLQFVEYVDEFKMGQQVEPDKFMSMDNFVLQWEMDSHPVAFIDSEAESDTFKKLQERGLKMKIIAQDARRLVITKP
ncbi:phospholipid carrier-dependent glycosyltransferase [Iodobacter fluviatilis]|uniref:Phospholipid carrier-dependent glycosyltransferase n=1 Tax=Iodobacter fluviatilis TaxID=537 RepID=A0A7G3GEH6_9NEIS|nr:phospholipid carrier-dependent glycosyltransferase [Iodobacter fluviatilis]QBC45392.1 phospholipid carrier-dependent glycosyltransferase [Iodobacter fluviatilis]